MTVEWQEHSETKRDWLDEFEDDELSRFGALTPVIWMGAGAVSFVVLYYGCFWLLKLGMWIYKF